MKIILAGLLANLGVKSRLIEIVDHEDYEIMPHEWNTGDVL